MVTDPTVSVIDVVNFDGVADDDVPPPSLPFTSQCYLFSLLLFLYLVEHPSIVLR